MVNSKSITLGALIVLALGLFLRLINLDADPSALLSRDFITDEGWWAHNARNALFFGQWRLDDYNLGLYSAYLYNYLLYFAFKALGVSFAAMRMISALAGWLTVLVLFLYVRREINVRAALIACTLLGFSNLHIVYSRTGFAESTMVFFLALMLWLWSLRRTHYLFALMSGAAFALMVLTKVTAIYFIPGFTLLIVVEAIRRSISRPQALSFLCGCVLVGAAYSIIFLVPNFSEWLRFNMSNGSGSEWSTEPSSLIYSMLKVLRSSFYAEAPVETALSFLAGYLFVVRISRSGLRKAISDARDIEVTSAALLIGYLFSLSLTIYQPERRFLPVFFLMVILSASVLMKGWASLREFSADYHVSAAGWFAVLFLLPAVGILDLKWRVTGQPASAMFWLTRGIMIAGLVAIAIALSRGLWPFRFRKSLLVGSKVIFILLFSSLSLALVHKALQLWGLNAQAWGSLLWGTRTVFIAASIVVLACAVFMMSGILQQGRRNAAWLICAVLLIEGAQISSWLIQPTYTLKEANTVLANTLTHDDAIVTYYETALISSSAKVICKSARRGFNVDAFEKFSPDYILVLRRDNWKDYALEGMPIEEWPPPAGFLPAKAASFDLCPTRLGGPRFIMELYRLSPRVRRHKRSSIDGN